MTFKMTFLIVVAFLHSNCDIGNQSILGSYKSTKPFLSIGNYTIGNTLCVKNDNTFLYETCGEIIRGKWKLKLDSLFLYCTTYTYKNDSLNKTLKTSCSENVPVEVFYVYKNGDLLSEFRYNNKTYRNRLKKIN